MTVTARSLRPWVSSDEDGSLQRTAVAVAGGTFGYGSPTGAGRAGGARWGEGGLLLAAGCLVLARSAGDGQLTAAAGPLTTAQADALNSTGQFP